MPVEISQDEFVNFYTAKAMAAAAAESPCEEGEEVGSATLPASPTPPEDLTSHARAMFRAWDTSGNGSLSHGELKRAMKKEATMKPLLSSESFHWKDVWARYDTNQDGSVSLWIKGRGEQ